MGWYGGYGGYGFKPYVSVASRRASAAKEVAKLAKKGQVISPIKIDGLKIARTFWGAAWCDHLESYGDFANRMPRGRTYVRNGSVVDLQISAGNISAMVSGSELYTVQVKIKPLAAATWNAIRRECRGKIGSLVELLQGRLSGGVMKIVTRQPGGFFPTPAEIEMRCSCPDSARVCKHVAATLYGVGARLDGHPELLFTLRKVDHLELIVPAEGGSGLLKGTTDQPTIQADHLEDVFGIELDRPVPVAAVPAAATADTRRRTGREVKASPPAAKKMKPKPKPIPPAKTATTGPMTRATARGIPRAIVVAPVSVIKAKPPARGKPAATAHPSPVPVTVTGTVPRKNKAVRQFNAVLSRTVAAVASRKQSR